MGRVWATWSDSERRSVAAALALLVLVAAVDLAIDRTVLLSLLVAAPLVGAIAAGPRTVVGIAAVTLIVAVPLGAAGGTFGETRHLIDLAVIALAGAVGFAIARTRDRLVRVREAEARAYERIALLDRSSRLVAAPLDPDARLKELTRLVIPDIADLCLIDLTTDDGRLDGVVASSTDPEHADLVRRTREHSPIRPESEHPVAVALRSGEPQLRGEITEDELARYATTPEHLATMRTLRHRSAIVVPLVARGRTLGVLSALRLGNAVAFGESDVSLMNDLASRAALAVDNARLFQEHQAAERRLQTVLDTLAEAITLVSPEGELVYLNDAAAQLFGHASPQEVLERGAQALFEDFELFDEAGQAFDLATLPGRRVLEGLDAPAVVLRRRHVATGRERWLRIKASAVLDPLTGEPSLAANVIEDVTDERRARDTAAFLAEASKVLASSLDFEQTLRRVAQLAVPQMADWCAVDVVEPDGEIRHVAAAHADATLEALVGELRERYPPEPGAPRGVPRVVATGVPELYPAVEPELLRETARDERHLELLEALDVASALVVPMVAGERTIGAITFATTGMRRHLGARDLDLARELGRRAGVAVENARVHRERSQIAATLQRSLLPPRLPVVPGLSMAARFRAAGEANQVGGDFYDLFPVDGSWMVVIGDVTGKGPGAAAITSLARYTIRTAAMYEVDPVAVVRRLNGALLAEGQNRQLCTAVCLRITPRGEGEPLDVAVVCAGHPSPYLLRGPDDLEEVCGAGPLLGAFRDATWTCGRFTLTPGESLVLYTDGVTDARGAEGRFGQRRLEALLRQVAGGDADLVAEAVDTTLLAFQEGPQRDDVALLVLRAGSAAEAAESSVVAGSAAGSG